MKTTTRHTPRLFDEVTLWELQNPGCHTGCGGCDYVAVANPADKAIDDCWQRELAAARQKLLAALRLKKS